MRSSLILYFSGTGNSRMAAESLSDRMTKAGIATSVRPLMHAAAAEALACADLVAVVFPVNFMQAPPPVLRRLVSMELSGKTIAAVATSGGEAGDALGQVADVIVRKKGRFLTGVHVPVADNSVVLKTPVVVRDANLAALGGKLDVLVAILLAQTNHTSLLAQGLGRRHPYWWRFTGWLTRAGMKLAYAYDRKQLDAEACTGCGICVRSCPIGNIRESGGKAVIGSDCADCFGCLHACPVSAIRFGRIRVSPASRYRLIGTAG